ncbi:hypothetical protein [Escherichia coli]|jgi:hypothetical protein|nr:hypothetical protein [Escherichia coli]MBB7598953.1 hypothetical protein [Escherichia coli]
MKKTQKSGQDVTLYHRAREMIQSLINSQGAAPTPQNKNGIGLPNEK